MLDKIVMLYKKAEMGLVSSLSGATSDVINETEFYDKGYIQTQISRIQKELKRVTDELKTILELKDDSEYSVKHKSQLLEKRQKLIFHLIFLASNSLGNLEDCFRLSEGLDFPFMQCVMALKEYKDGRKDNAFELLEKYYCKYGSVEEHFLVNKVFGILLVERGQYHKAIPFLTYALQFIPNDYECLKILHKCYMESNEIGRANVINEILMVLRGEVSDV